MGKKKHHDIEWLKKQYHDKGRTQSDIAEECGITQSTLSGHMKRHGITARSNSEAAERALKPDKPYTDPEWLRREYHDKERTLYEIADEFDMTATGIAHWMDKHGIERRDNRDAQRPEGKHTDPEWLRERYHTDGMTLQEVADEAGVSVSQVHKWMDDYGIERRRFDYDRRTGPVSIQSVYGRIGDLPGGWVQIRSKNPTDEKAHDSLYVHQLLAIAEGADPYKVFSGGDYHVHHENRIRWDNRPDNIELLSEEEHVDTFRRDDKGRYTS